jgi:hypothetical protein
VGTASTGRRSSSWSSTPRPEPVAEFRFGSCAAVAVTFATVCFYFNCRHQIVLARTASQGHEPTFTGPSPNPSSRHKCAVYDALKRALSIPRSKDGISQVRRSQRAFEPTHT